MTPAVLSGLGLCRVVAWCPLPKQDFGTYSSCLPDTHVSPAAHRHRATYLYVFSTNLLHINHSARRRLGAIRAWGWEGNLCWSAWPSNSSKAVDGLLGEGCGSVITGRLLSLSGGGKVGDGSA